MLDLDMLIRRNIDELFELRAPAAMKRASGKEQPKHGEAFSGDVLWRQYRDDMNSGINAGVMLLQPDMQVYERMVAEIKDPRHPEHIGTYGPEQDYLTRFYCTFLEGTWAHMHARFNFQLALPDDYVSSAYRQLNIRRDVAVAHYSGPRVKPWELSRDEPLNVAGVRYLLENYSSRNSKKEETPSPGAADSKSALPRERIMDGVLVVDNPANTGLSPELRDLMDEWVSALRECAKELGEAGIDVLTIVQQISTNP